MTRREMEAALRIARTYERCARKHDPTAWRSSVDNLLNNAAAIRLALRAANQASKDQA